MNTDTNTPDITLARTPDDDGITRLDDHKLRELAFDIMSGKVFTSRFLAADEASSALLPLIFMPLAFMDKDDIGRIITHSCMLFEYYSEAGPRSINGYPCFMSMRVLHIDHWLRLCELINEWSATKDAFLAPDGGSA